MPIMNEDEFVRESQSMPENKGVDERLIRGYYQQKIKPKYEAEHKDSALDIPISVGQGLTGAAQGLYGVADAVTGGNLDDALGHAPSQGLNDLSNWLQDQKSSGLKLEENEFAGADGLWDSAKVLAHSPWLVATGASQALGYAPSTAMAVRGIVGAVGRKVFTGVLKQLVESGKTKEEAMKIAARVARKSSSKVAEAADIGANTAVVGGQNYEQGRSTILNMSDDQLNALPDYKELRSHLSPQQAKDALSTKYGYEAAATASILSAVASKVSGAAAFEGKLFTGEGVGGAVKGATHGFLKEGTQEGIESAGEQLGQNLANKNIVDPNQDLSASVGKNALIGVVAGGGAGGGMGLGGGLFSRPSVKKHADDAADEVNQKAEEYVSDKVKAAADAGGDALHQQMAEADARQHVDADVAAANNHARNVKSQIDGQEEIYRQQEEDHQKEVSIAAQRMADHADTHLQADYPDEGMAELESPAKPTPEQAEVAPTEQASEQEDGTDQFKPTHELNNGTPVKAVEDESDVWVDSTGQEWVDPDATEIKTADTKAIDAAANESATSPENDLPEPTTAQIEAGNYKKGHVNVQGLDIAIENPKGSVRTGTSENGKQWQTDMQHHYGYIKGTVGKDKDHVDVFLGDNADKASNAYVVDQVNPETGKFDEHKVVIGPDNEADARKAYSDNYDKDWKGLSNITAMPIDKFKQWVKDPEQTKIPAASIQSDIEASPKTSTDPDPIASKFVSRIGAMLDPGKNKSLLRGGATSAWNDLRAHGDDYARDRYKILDDVLREQGTSVEKALGSRSKLWKEIKSFVGENDASIDMDEKPSIETKTSEKVKPVEQPASEKPSEPITEPAEKSGAEKSGAEKSGVEKSGVENNSPEYKKAKSDLDDALNDIGDIFLSANLFAKKAKPTDLNSADLIPVLTRVMDAYFRMGYHKFKDASRATLNAIREKFGDAAADSINLHHLQGAYIGMGKGSNSIHEVGAVNHINEINEHEVEQQAEQQPEESPEPQKSLSDFLGDRYDDITDNRKLRNAVAEYNNVKYNDVSDKDLKQAQEVLEAQVVKHADAIVKEGGDNHTIFNKLVALYNAQPNLNVRSSTSMENQAYSTPAPMAFVASRLAGITNKSTVYEPTAGNGMLLIGVDPAKAEVNELNDDRVKSLKSLGYKVTQEDAATYLPTKAVDSVIMNPPFGKMDQGQYEGYRINKIDHQIVLKSLEAMKDDGSATLIIGAVKNGGFGGGEKPFFNYLYSHYNVTSMFEADGKLYNRQGAGWPTRIITINGRVNSDNIAPYTKSVPRFNDWEELYAHFSTVLDTKGSARSDTTAVRNKVNEGTDNQTNSEAENVRQNINATQPRVKRRSLSSAGNRKHGQGNEQQLRNSGNDDGIVGNGNGNVDSRSEQGNDQATNGKRNRDRSEGTNPSQPDVGLEHSADRLGEENDGSEYQTKYHTVSGGANDDVQTPNNMARPMSQFLKRIDKEVGGIDQYVIDNIGYKDKDDLYKSFMGLQIDAIAAAIYNVENKNKGIIIADQTGVGKGRQAAAMIRYAIKQGKTPVFITVKPNLYTDMYDDLQDIGGSEVKPLITNSKTGIKDSKGGPDKFVTANPRNHKQVLEGIVESGELPEGHNALFTTYDQLKSTDPRQIYRRDALSAIGSNAFFILDEAHTAAGEQEIKLKDGHKRRTVSGFIADEIENSPVVYLSATYAKRPDNYAVYYRTDLMDAVDNTDELVDAVSNGGVPLQTIMANMLSESGQLFRRERSFKGITVKPEVIDNPAKTKAHTAVYNNMAKGMRAISMADRAFSQVFMKQVKDKTKGQNKQWKQAGNKASQSVDHNSFSSIFHNYVGQLLLALKASEVADKSISLIEQGVKPVIALENTMGSVLDNAGVSIGDNADASFKDILLHGLKRSRRYSIKDEKGNSETYNVPLSELDPLTRNLYVEAEKVISGLDIESLPISPIDYIRDRIEQAGHVTGELTGRQARVDYKEPGHKVYRRDQQEIDDKRATVDKFNDGSLDALVLNVAGSTGLSLHASEKFKDQKPRHMIVAQPARDINIFMQMLGRINRTGQIELPQYSLFSTSLPAEKRPLAVTLGKLASLNANTSANDKSDVSFDAPDIFNMYGDQVVNDYLNTNPEITSTVDMVKDIYTSDGKPTSTDIARKFTGRAALLDVAQLDGVYEDIFADYKELIDYLDSTGQNELVTRDLDLDADILGSEIFYEGGKTNSLFGGNTIMHQVSTKYQGKPPTSGDVIKTMDRNLGGKTPEQFGQDIVDSLKKDNFIEETINQNKDRYDIFNKKWQATAEKDGLAEHGSLAGIVDFLQENEDKRVVKYHKFQLENERIGDDFAALEEKYKALQRTVENAINNTFMVGNRIRLDLGDERVTGVVTNIKNSHRLNHGNPYSLSKTKISFMVNSGVRNIELNLVKLQTNGDIFTEELTGKGKQGLQEVFDQTAAEASTRREKRYIATGNLIMGQAKLNQGKIVRFTDKKGNKHNGILMPKNYNEGSSLSEAVAGQRVAVKDPAVAAQFLRTAKSPINVLRSSDGEVSIQPDEDGWQIIVPRSGKSKDGNAVKFDDKLRSIVGDFHGRSTTMSAELTDGQLESALKRLIELVPMSAVGSARDALVKSGMPQRDEAVESFSGHEEDSLMRASTASQQKVPVDVEAVVDNITGKWRNSPDIVVVPTHDALPESLKKDVAKEVGDSSIDGAYHRGKVYIVADKVANKEHAEKIIFHEVLGHKGLRNIYGTDLSKQLNSIFMGIGGRKGLERLASKYGVDLSAYNDNIKGTDRDKILTEELLSFIAESRAGEGVSSMAIRKAKEVFGAIRQWMRDHGFATLSKLTDSDIMHTLRQARDSVVSNNKSNVHVASDDNTNLRLTDIQQMIKDSDLGEEMKRPLQRLWQGVKSQALGALTLRQLGEVTSKVVPAINEQYMPIKDRMVVETNKWLSKGGEIATKRTKLNKAENIAVAGLQQDATIAGVDPAKPYLPRMTSEMLEEIKENMIANTIGTDGENSIKVSARIEQMEQMLEEEPARKAAYEKLKPRYNNLSREAKTIYTEERNYHSEMNEERFSILQDKINKTPMAAETKRDLINNLKEKFETYKVSDPYFPLSRFGEFWVYSADQNGEFSFNMFETASQRDAFKKQLEKSNHSIIGVGKNLEGMQRLDGVSASFVSDVDDKISSLGDHPMVNELRKSIYDMYLQTLPDLSARKHFIHRKKTRGFEKDQARAFADAVQHGSRDIGRLRYADQLRDVINDAEKTLKAAESTFEMDKLNEEIAKLEDYASLANGMSGNEIAAKTKKGSKQDRDLWKERMVIRNRMSTDDVDSEIERLKAVRDEAEKLSKTNSTEFAAYAIEELRKSHDALLNPNTHPIAQTLNAIGFMYFLGATPAAAFVNLTQTPIIALPLIGAKYGFKNATKQLAKASKDFFSKDDDGNFGIDGAALNADERRAFIHWHEEGLLDNTLAHDTAGIAENGVNNGSMRHKLMNIASFMFHHAERFNREISALAAYRSAREKGVSHDQALQDSTDIVWKAHFDYTAANRSRFLRGNFMRVAAQFKQYGQSVMYLYGRLFIQAAKKQGFTKQEQVEARKALAGILSMQFALAGAAGLPLSGMLMGLAQLIADMVDGDDDPYLVEPELRQAVTTALVGVLGKEAGKLASQALSQGLVNSLTPMNLSGRISHSDMFMRSSDYEDSGRSAAYNTMKAIGGVSTSYIEMPYLFMDQLRHNNYAKAAETLLPKFAKDIVKGADYAIDDARTMRGYLLKKMTIPEIALQMVGFSSSNLTDQYSMNAAKTNLENRLKTRRSKIIDQLVRARQGDYDMDEARADMREWNKHNPSNRVTMINVRQSERSRSRYAKGVESGKYISRRYRKPSSRFDWATN